MTDPATTPRTRYAVRVLLLDTDDRVLLREHGLDDIRWWTLDELAASQEDFTPRRLLELVREIVNRGAPPAPIDVGI